MADYTGIPALLVRALAVVALIMFSLPTLIIYFGAAWLLDDAPEQLYDLPKKRRFGDACVRHHRARCMTCTTGS